MSQENVEIVRQSYEIAKSIGRTGADFVDPEEVAPAFWARLDPDVELHDLGAARCKGLSGTGRREGVLAQDPAGVRGDPLGAAQFMDLGDAVVVETRVVALGRGSEVPIEMDETDVFWFRDGMIVRLQGFATKTEALEAAGLSE